MIEILTSLLPLIILGVTVFLNEKRLDAYQDGMMEVINAIESQQKAINAQADVIQNLLKSSNMNTGDIMAIINALNQISNEVNNNDILQFKESAKIH